VALLEPFIPSRNPLPFSNQRSSCFYFAIPLFFHPRCYVHPRFPLQLSKRTQRSKLPPLLATQMAFSSSIAETPWKTRRKGPSEKDNFPSISLIMRGRVTIRVLWAPVWNPFPWAFSFPLVRLFSVMEGILSCSNFSLDRSCYR
jgi:hypothetical protein